MKRLYSILIVIVALVVFAPLAVAADGHPAWNNQIKGPGRFQVLSKFTNAAAFDKETGLVWERQPSTGAGDWFNRRTRRYNLEVGGRKGWRVPTIEELASLVDTSQPAPTLPAGHPFINVQSSVYWSATTDAGDTSGAWAVNFNGGGVGASDKTNSHFVWCVRGGQGIDGL